VLLLISGEPLALPLQGLHLCPRRQQLENLLNIDLDAIAAKGVITEDHPQWFVSGR
jgi:hypothetical protein